MKAARAGHMDTVRFLVDRGEDRHTDTLMRSDMTEFTYRMEDILRCPVRLERLREDYYILCVCVNP